MSNHLVFLKVRSVLLVSALAVGCGARVSQNPSTPDERPEHSATSSPTNVVGVWRTCVDEPVTCDHVGAGYEFLADGTWRPVSSALADDAPSDRFCYLPGRIHGRWSQSPAGVVMDIGGHVRDDLRFRVRANDRVSFLRGGHCEHLRRVDSALNRGVCNEPEAACSDDSECYSGLCEMGHCMHEGLMEPPGMFQETELPCE